MSYSKGCYVGQERNSFTHFRGVVRRRCAPLRLLGPLPPRLAAAADALAQGRPQGGGGTGAGEALAVVVQGSGEVVGAVRGLVGGFGVAHLRLSAMGPGASGEGGPPLAVSCASDRSASVPVRTFRPGWWLPEWGREEGGQEEGAKQ